MMNKKGEEGGFTVRKVVVIILFLVVLILVVVGLMSGQINPLLGKLRGGYNSVLIKFGLIDDDDFVSDVECDRYDGSSLKSFRVLRDDYGVKNSDFIVCKESADCSFSGTWDNQGKEEKFSFKYYKGKMYRGDALYDEMYKGNSNFEYLGGEYLDNSLEDSKIYAEFYSKARNYMLELFDLKSSNRFKIFDLYNKKYLSSAVTDEFSFIYDFKIWNDKRTWVISDNSMAYIRWAEGWWNFDALIDYTTGNDDPSAEVTSNRNFNVGWNEYLCRASGNSWTKVYYNSILLDEEREAKYLLYGENPKYGSILSDTNLCYQRVYSKVNGYVSIVRLYSLCWKDYLINEMKKRSRERDFETLILSNGRSFVVNGIDSEYFEIEDRKFSVPILVFKDEASGERYGLKIYSEKYFDDQDDFSTFEEDLMLVRFDEKKNKWVNVDSNNRYHTSVEDDDIFLKRAFASEVLKFFEKNCGIVY